MHPPERRMVDPYVQREFSSEETIVMDDLDETSKRKARKSEE